MHQEQIDKIRQYLLDQGQQELVGHFDLLIQELNSSTHSESDDLGANGSQDFQDKAGAAEKAAGDDTPRQPVPGSSEEPTKAPLNQ